MYMIKRIKTSTFNKLLIPPGIGIKAFINHMTTPTIIINAIKFNNPAAITTLLIRLGLEPSSKSYSAQKYNPFPKVLFIA